MKTYYKILAALSFLTSTMPSFAQNALENLRLAEQVNIYFESSKYNLTDQASWQLQEVVAKYKSNNALKMRITAHTDGQGNQQDNYVLSDKRANAVKYYFISKGVPPEAIVASTFGKDKPLADNETENGRKMNRRATVEIYEPAPEKVKIVEKQVIVEKPVIQTQIVERVVEKSATQAPIVEKMAENTPKSLEIASKPVEVPKIIEDTKPYLQGVIQNSNTRAGIQAMVFVRHLNGKIDSFLTEDNGTFKLLCVYDEPVTIDVFAKGYFYNSENVIVQRNAAQNIELQPLQIGSVATISNLYFVGDEATLLKSSDAEMAKILRFMQLNKNIKIEIAGHVNAPGVDPKKLPKEEFDLSTDRAITIRNFLIDNGFSNEKITAKGYGNSQMRYPEPTSERQEELNRRVEIKVLDIKSDSMGFDTKQ
jgi:outer membrane protein OmpA-like peptidoglycan-associated protein